MVTVKIRSHAFERFAQLLAACDRTIPAARYVRDATELSQLTFNAELFSVNLQKVFGILITPGELRMMTKVGDIINRWSSTITKPEQVLSQQVAHRIRSSLGNALAMDASLQRFELVFRVARQQGANDPIRFRWSPMHQLPEIKIEYRPADLVDWGEDSHFDVSETHTNIDAFVSAYQL